MCFHYAGIVFTFHPQCSSSGGDTEASFKTNYTQRSVSRAERMSAMNSGGDFREINQSLQKRTRQPDQPDEDL